MTQDEIAAFCVDQLVDILRVPKESVDVNVKFTRLGLDSAMRPDHRRKLGGPFLLVIPVAVRRAARAQPQPDHHAPQTKAQRARGKLPADVIQRALAIEPERKRMLQWQRWIACAPRIMKEAVLKVLEQEGYIASFRRVQEGGRPVLRVGLKYDGEGEPIVTGLERVSRPGRRVYARADSIPSVLGGLGVSIVSTSKGIVADKTARESRLGGEVLCNVW